MKTRTVTLNSPIQRGETVIANISLREPSAGDLRGLNLSDVMQMNVGTMSRLIPRVTEPGLTPDEVSGLPGGDLVALSLAVIGFFFTEEQMAEEARRLQ